MSDNENMEKQEPVIITFNDVEYRQSDLSMLLAENLQHFKLHTMIM